MMDNISPFQSPGPPTMNTLGTAPVVGEKKRKHKLTEQKGRQKINTQINDLKNMLPECKYVMTTKASVLECAVKSLQRMQSLCNQLMHSNKQLQKENKQLRTELAKYSTTSFGSDILDDLVSDRILQMPPSVSNFEDLSQVDGLTGNDDLLGSNFGLDYSPSSSDLLHEIHSPSSEDFGFDESEEFHKVSKRRILMVFLFMLPFFLSLDNFTLGAQTGLRLNSRVLLEDSRVDSPISYSYYFDILKFIWYMVLSIVGVMYIVHSLLWINGFGQHTVKISQKARRNFLSPIIKIMMGKN